MAAQGEGVGKGLVVVAGFVFAQQVRFGRTQEIRVGLAAKQAVEFVERGDVLDVAGVEIEERIVEIGQAMAMGAGAEHFDFLADAAVVLEEGVAGGAGGFPGGDGREDFLAGAGGGGLAVFACLGQLGKEIVLHQRGANENVGGFFWVDLVVSDLPVVELQAVKGGFFGDEDASGLGAPVRVRGE